jgi:Skp family chaperone for outer membrane proteins
MGGIIMHKPARHIDTSVQRTPAPVDFKSSPDYMKREIERLKAELQSKNANTIKLQNENEKLKLEMQYLENVRDRLTEEKYNLYHELDIKSQRPFNERGAGRKSKITQEIKDFVVELRQNGNSFAEISYICAENGFPISKSTVDRILREWVTLNSFQN